MGHIKGEDLSDFMCLVGLGVNRPHILGMPSTQEISLYHNLMPSGRGLALHAHYLKSLLKLANLMQAAVWHTARPPHSSCPTHAMHILPVE